MFTAAVIGGGGIVGSIITALLAGGILWGLFYWATGRIRMDWRAPVVWASVALASYFLADLLSALANDRTAGAIKAVVETIPYLGLPVIFARLGFSERQDVLDAVEWGAIAGGIATGLYAFIEVYLLHEWRASGLAGNSGPFAIVATVLYGICILAALRRSGSRRLVAILAAALAALALVLSGMRTLAPALIGLPLLPIVLGLGRWSLSRVARYAAVVILVIAAIGALSHDRLAARFASITTEMEMIDSGDMTSSIGQRLLMIDVGMELAAERPILGHGPNSIPELLAERTATDGPMVLSYSHLHNFLLTAQVRSGVIGVLAILAVLFVPLFISWRHRHRDAVARAGFAILAVVVSVYLLSGAGNIMLGHDITDTLFIYATIVCCYLSFGNGNSDRVGTTI